MNRNKQKYERITLFIGPLYEDLPLEYQRKICQRYYHKWLFLIFLIHHRCGFTKRKDKDRFIWHDKRYVNYVFLHGGRKLKGKSLAQPLLLVLQMHFAGMKIELPIYLLQVYWKYEGSFLLFFTLG